MYIHAFSLCAHMQDFYKNYLSWMLMDVEHAAVGNSGVSCIIIAWKLQRQLKHKCTLGKVGKFLYYVTKCRDCVNFEIA